MRKTHRIESYISKVAILLQSNVSVVDMLYNGHLVMADIFLESQSNHGQTLIEKPLYSGHFYSGHLL